VEEEVEGWPQFAADVSVIGDKDPDEHRLVDLAAKLRPGFVIGAAEVGNEGEGGFEVPFDDVEFEPKGGVRTYRIVSINAVPQRFVNLMTRFDKPRG
jgi:hypothetical protein